MALEIIGAIVSILVAAGSIIGYRTRTDIREAFLSTIIVIVRGAR